MKTPIQTEYWFHPTQLALKLGAIGACLTLIMGLSAELTVAVLFQRTLIGLLILGIFGFVMGLVLQFFHFDQLSAAELNQVTEVKWEDVSAKKSAPPAPPTTRHLVESPSQAVIPRPEQNLTPQ